MDNNKKYEDLFDEWRKFTNGQENQNPIQEAAIYKYDPSKPGEKGTPVSVPGVPTQGQKLDVDLRSVEDFPRDLAVGVGVIAVTTIVNDIFKFAGSVLSGDIITKGLAAVGKGTIIGSVIKMVTGMSPKDAKDLEDAAGKGSPDSQAKRLGKSKAGRGLLARFAIGGLKIAGIAAVAGLILWLAHKAYQQMKEVRHPAIKNQPKTEYSGFSASKWEHWGLAAQCAFCEENKRKPINHATGEEVDGPECSDVLKRCKDLDKEALSFSTVGIGDEEALMRMLYAETSWRKSRLEMAAIVQVAMNRLKRQGKKSMIDVVSPQRSGWNDASTVYTRGFINAAERFNTPAAARAREIIQNVMRGNSPVGDLNGAQNFIHPGNRGFKFCSEKHLTKLGKKFMCYDLAALPGGRKFGKKRKRIPIWSVHISQGGTSKSIPKIIGTVLISNGDRE
jgi:hypothetical protein